MFGSCRETSAGLVCDKGHVCAQPWIRENFAKQYEEMKGRGGVVEPEAIAEQYWQLSVQRREAWTHELDIRPWLEKW